MIYYKIEDFKKWIEQEPNRKRDLTNWEEIYNQLGDEFTEESLDNLTEYPIHQEIIKEWINSLENPEEFNRDSPIPGSFPTDASSKPKPLKKARSFDNYKKKSTEEPITTDLTKELSKKVKENQKLISQLQKQVKALKILAEDREERLEQEQKALITLAKKKLANKKDARELVEELEKKLIASNDKSEEFRRLVLFNADSSRKYEKSAEYLKEELIKSENHLATTSQELVEAKEQIKQQRQDFQEQFELKEEELTKKQEIVTVLQQRNADLQKNKLPTRDQEITKLTEWISQLENASARGNAWAELQTELSQSKRQITSLQSKHTNKHYWAYALLVIVIIYLALR